MDKKKYVWNLVEVEWNRGKEDRKTLCTFSNKKLAEKINKVFMLHFAKMFPNNVYKEDNGFSIYIDKNGYETISYRVFGSDVIVSIDKNRFKNL